MPSTVVQWDNYIGQKCGFWSNPDSPCCHKKNKKKDHQNQTIIGEMTAILISVPVKVPFLWTVVQVEHAHLYLLPLSLS